MNTAAAWRRCNACKGPIATGATYWVCSVSTCNRKRTGMTFCTVSCWEVHLPSARHREAWAVEKTAPLTPESESERRGEPAARAPRRTIPKTPPAPTERGDALEVLIVASRMKEYIRKRSGYNTSDRVLEPLSKIVRRACDEAIDRARRDGRQTVLDRDIPKP